MITQTVRFEMRVRFDDSEREGQQETTLFFHEFDKMMERVSKERRRRKRGDRATSATYRMHLTRHGQDVCCNDEYATARHAEAIEGKWFTWF